MDSLWVGSDVDLSVLHRCRIAERLEYRLSCLSNNRKKKNQRMGREDEGEVEEDARVTFEEEHEECLRRRRRSGTWP